MYLIYMFGGMLIFAILCMYCVDASNEQATVDSEVQQVEVAEQELIEGKLCPYHVCLYCYD
jgi:hypothetical protein